MPLWAQIFLFSESEIGEMFTKAKSNQSTRPGILPVQIAKSPARRVISGVSQLKIKGGGSHEKQMDWFCRYYFLYSWLGGNGLDGKLQIRVQAQCRGGADQSLETGGADVCRSGQKKSDGRINIKCYFSGQLFAGKQTDEFLLLKQGVTDFAIGSTINWSTTAKELNLFSLPFFFHDYKALDAVEIGAIEESGDIYRVIPDRCIGCGLCIGHCPTEAIRLIHKDQEERTPPPITEDDWFDERGKKRGVNFLAYKYSFLNSCSKSDEHWFIRFIRPLSKPF
jgi:NAD-dependent dihydropyrimidine dehydrogenase PreA subunit